MSVCVGDRDVASKWVPLISMVLFTLSNAKHQRNKSQSLTVNGPFMFYLFFLKLLCDMDQHSCKNVTDYDSWHIFVTKSNLVLRLRYVNLCRTG